MIKKDGPFGSVTITDAPDEYRYVRVECPECATLRAEVEHHHDAYVEEARLHDALRARIKELEKESRLHLESADSMKAAWNAACEDISILQSRIAKLEKVAEAAENIKYVVCAELCPAASIGMHSLLCEDMLAALAELKEG